MTTPPEAPDAPSTEAAPSWETLRKTATAELCAEGRLDGSPRGPLRLERWWVRAAGEELLRISRYDPDGRLARGPVYVNEAEMIGLLDAAWQAGVLSDFFKRQLFHLVARRFEEDAPAT